MICSLVSIHIYPMKSCAPLTCGEAQLEPSGLRHDRRWMVVDAMGKALTGRECPKLTLIRARPGESGLLHLEAPEMPAITVQAPFDPVTRVETAVWSSSVAPALATADAHAWLSAFLKQSVRLLHMDPQCLRPLDSKYAQPGDVVSLADSFPVLLISKESVDLLNTKLAIPVPMLQFRPNLVISGQGPHVEDGWKCIQIGETEFEVGKPRTLCVFANVDFKRGERDASGEPLRTLARYRNSVQGLTFGQKLIPRRLGTIRVGDLVKAIA
ncbi:MOSC domain-containing protein [Xanthomonas graminis]|uniref:MOSC domain-containing protein n=1 Tax=Xanthomonas graminis TaxID=3390026 RepID=UPI0009C16757|nr:MOSC N-terminal beta barrel domain-containing protein [Xanthomonas translucens]